MTLRVSEVQSGLDDPVPNHVIARSGATEQSSRFDKLKAPSPSRDWIVAARFAHLAMTRNGEKATT
jgi:hypothetical protein